MLQQLIEGLRRQNLYITKPLRDIEHSCCASTKVVLDFDAVKEAYYRQVGPIGQTPKSCDVLLIEVDKQKIIFGEMKNMDKFIERFICDFLEETERIPTASTITNQVSDKIKSKYRPDQKMVDSLLLLLEIADYCGVDAALFPYVTGKQCALSCYFIMKLQTEYALLLEEVWRREGEYYRYHNIGPPPSHFRTHHCCRTGHVQRFYPTGHWDIKMFCG